MSTTAPLLGLNAKPPCRLADIPGDWIELRREIVVREGHAVRAGAAHTIEVQAINTGVFHPLCLPSGGIAFATEDARDAVLAQLQGVK